MRKLELSRVICFEIAKGRTIRNNRRGVENFWCINFFKKPACLQEFFLGHMTYWFRYHRLQDFFF